MQPRTSVLVVAGLTALVAGASAADQPSGPRGNVVFPAGDKLRGYLRGGETHALQVHLAKGDSYASTLSAKGVNDLLLMHVAVIDPTGRDMSIDAHVRHTGNGKRVTVGPFRVAKSGTYSVLVTGMGMWEGAYSGSSKLHGARRSTYVLPADGSVVDVPAAAGSALRLRTKGSVTSLVMALPQDIQQTFAAADPLVGTLLGRGLPTSESGTFRFAAPNASSTAKIEVVKPRWKAGRVEVTALPDDPSRQASYQWILDWINEATVQPTTTVDTHLPTDPPVLSMPPASYGGMSWGVGAPIAVDASATLATKSKATLFVGGSLDAAGAFPEHAHPVDPVTGTVAPPTTTPDPTPPAPPPVTTPPVPMPDPPYDIAKIPRGFKSTGLGTGYYMVGIPTMSCSQLVGKSMLFTLYTTNIYASGMRDAPWTKSASSYPKAVTSAIAPLQSLDSNWYSSSYGRNTSSLKELPGSETGPEADPFVRRTFASQLVVDGKTTQIGTITTTARYYVDNHQVDSLLAGTGEYVIAWDVAGAGTVHDAPWTVAGSWKLTMHLPEAGIIGTKPGTMACILAGSETYSVGSLKESVTTDGLTLHPMNYYYDVTGNLKNRLSAPEFGLTQTVDRTFLPSRFPWVGNTLDRYKPVDAKLTTVIETFDPVQGVHEDVDEDQQLFDFFLC